MFFIANESYPDKVVVDRVCVEQRGTASSVSRCLEQRGNSFPLAEGGEQCASQSVVCTACGCLVYRVVCPCVFSHPD